MVKSGRKVRVVLFHSSKIVERLSVGYATSPDGRWIRRDDETGPDVVPGTFASTAIMYSAVLKVREKTYCFYNGDDFGRNGFAVAILVKLEVLEYSDDQSRGLCQACPNSTFMHTANFPTTETDSLIDISALLRR